MTGLNVQIVIAQILTFFNYHLQITEVNAPIRISVGGAGKVLVETSLFF